MDLGIAESADKVHNLAAAAKDIKNNVNITATVTEGSVYTIPKGYHDGFGTVTGLPPGITSIVERWWSPKMVGRNTPSPYEIFTNTSSAPSPGCEIWKLFDYNDDTYVNIATSASNPTWIGIDCGKPMLFEKARIRIPSTESRTPHMYLIYCGDERKDPSEKININTVQFGAFPQFQGRTEVTIHFPTDLSRGYRYWYIGPSPTYHEMGRRFILSELQFLLEEQLTKYSLQEDKTVVPTKETQLVTPDSGYYGFSSLTVSPIPSNFAETSVVSATEDDVLDGKVIVDRDGEAIVGTILNHGTSTASIDSNGVNLDAGYYKASTISLNDTIEKVLSGI